MDYTEKLKRYINLEQEVLEKLPYDEINEVMNVLENARLSNKRIFICGNGGECFNGVASRM